MVWFIAAVDSVLSVFLLNFALLSLYYVIRYARTESLTSHSSIRNSVIAGVLLVSAWLFSTQWILQQLFATHPVYTAFLQGSLALRFIAGLFVASLVYLSFFLSIYQSSVQEAAQRESELKVLLQKTELQALKNQLNPHFIYNSLNSISALTLYSPDKAREMVGLLSDFLRIALRQDAMQTTTLEEEINNIALYLQIEKVRFEEKLHWSFELDPRLNEARIPALILQPVFENAVKHGVQQMEGSSTVVLRAFTADDKLVLEVENGFDPRFKKFKGEGVGLENIRNRMHLIYGSSQHVSAGAAGSVFLVRLTMPLVFAHSSKK